MRITQFLNNRLKSLRLSLLFIVSTGLSVTICSASDASDAAVIGAVPAERFDLSHWKLTLPLDESGDGKPDSIRVVDLQSYAHSDFFYFDDQCHMVFTAPNKGASTRNSGSTRSKLRYMLRGSNRRVKNSGPLNNFGLASHAKAEEFVSIGGRMEATLHIDHVPLKIFYKKLPGHQTGSVYWTHERNLPRGNPARKDIAYLISGKPRTDRSDLGAEGIALGENFSYIVKFTKTLST